MAAHLRSQIRTAIAGALVGLPTTADRVYESRLYPLDSSELPGLTVSSGDESIEVQNMSSPRILKRLYQVNVGAYAKNTDELDDELDQMVKEIELALAMPCAALVGISASITLTKIPRPEVVEAEKPSGYTTLVYEVEYWTMENAPDVPVAV